MKHIIIGGVAGGATAAARLRRIDEHAEIILIEKSKYISYANCGLPYYIGGVIAEREKLFVQSAEQFANRFQVDVRTEQEAIDIDSAKQTIHIRRKDGTTYEESYDKLLLSPGANAIVPPLPGINTEGIFTLKNVEDTDNIKAYLQTHSVKDAVVVGAGFIGLEMAENLVHAGIKVSIVEMSNQVMAPIDFSMAAHVHQHLIDKGINLYLERGVSSFEKTNSGIKVMLNDGNTLETQLVLLSIGVKPSIALAQKAGLEIGERGIKVNELLQTSDPNIYAVGDAIEYKHPITKEAWTNLLAGPANRQGRIVANNMVGNNPTPYEGAIGTAIAKVFDLTVATAGVSAKRLQQLNIAYKSSTTISPSHAGYYPRAFPMTIKVVFDPKTGVLYGAQAIGVEGVDKRIDIAAQYIKQGKTVADLICVEHAYAPPYASAKDPIAIAGYVAQNIITQAMIPIYWRELEKLDRQTVQLIDVRTPMEYELGSIQGAMNIPLDEIRTRINEIDTDKEVVLFCQVGLRGYLAQRILIGRGYKNVKNLSGGYKTYSVATAKLPTPNCNTTNHKNSCNTTNMTNLQDNPAPRQSTSNPTETNKEMQHKTIKVDACGLQCPGPIMKLKQAIDSMAIGECVELKATDAGFPRDAQAWCNTTGHTLVDQYQEGGTHTVVIKKMTQDTNLSVTSNNGKNKTFIMFSDDLDRALATFVLANGAAATGHRVSIFFTFWGLNVVKKQHKPHVEKDIFGKMFSMMLPSSSLKLKLSKMSMFGIGDKMMRYIMRRKGISQLEELRSQALENGVEFIACQMSMDMMGVDRKELLDEISIGGVATYMERAEEANINLFI